MLVASDLSRGMQLVDWFNALSTLDWLMVEGGNPLQARLLQDVRASALACTAACAGTGNNSKAVAAADAALDLVLASAGTPAAPDAPPFLPAMHDSVRALVHTVRATLTHAVHDSAHSACYSPSSCPQYGVDSAAYITGAQQAYDAPRSIASAFAAGSNVREFMATSGRPSLQSAPAASSGTSSAVHSVWSMSATSNAAAHGASVTSGGRSMQIAHSASTTRSLIDDLTHIFSQRHLATEQLPQQQQPLTKQQQKQQQQSGSVGQQQWQQSYPDGQLQQQSYLEFRQQQGQRIEHRHSAGTYATATPIPAAAGAALALRSAPASYGCIPIAQTLALVPTHTSAPLFEDLDALALLDPVLTAALPVPHRAGVPLSGSSAGADARLAPGEWASESLANSPAEGGEWVNELVGSEDQEGQEARAPGDWMRERNAALLVSSLLRSDPSAPRPHAAAAQPTHPRALLLHPDAAPDGGIAPRGEWAQLPVMRGARSSARGIGSASDGPVSGGGGGGKNVQLWGGIERGHHVSAAVLPRGHVRLHPLLSRDPCPVCFRGWHVLRVSMILSSMSGRFAHAFWWGRSPVGRVLTWTLNATHSQALVLFTRSQFCLMLCTCCVHLSARVCSTRHGVHARDLFQICKIVSSVRTNVQLCFFSSNQFISRACIKSLKRSEITCASSVFQVCFKHQRMGARHRLSFQQARESLSEKESKRERERERESLTHGSTHSKASYKIIIITLPANFTCCRLRTRR